MQKPKKGLYAVPTWLHCHSIKPTEMWILTWTRIFLKTLSNFLQMWFDIKIIRYFILYWRYHVKQTFIYSKSIIETLEKSLVLSLLLLWTYSRSFSRVSIVGFDQLNVCWGTILDKIIRYMKYWSMN